MSIKSKTDNELSILENSMNISTAVEARMEISHRNDNIVSIRQNIINSTGTKRQEWINYLRKTIPTYVDKHRAINDAKQLIPEFTM